MDSTGFKRKLTAILSADVVGYSRLMGEDEESTVRTLNKYKELIFSLIGKNNGRVIDSPGDNVLAEFASVVDALRCGVQIQEDLKSSNEELPENKRMEFRIGIHTGDVIQDGDRIYGDGVNIAARIESLADPGGICISRTAYDQVKGKIDIDYEYLGEYEVKNIREPVRVYKIQKEKSELKISTESKTSTLSEKPSIAVLPFIDLSPEKDQEYFVDGLSEEILNSLAQIPDINVAGRTSSFSFKGTKKKVQEIVMELGVKNILEGSVRKAGNALRITVQLLRGVDGFHLWSRTYDRELKVKEIFAIQEDIAVAVAGELKVKLGIDHTYRQLGSTNNIEAYELYLIAIGLNFQEASSDLYKRQLKLLEEAIELDSDFALAWALKGMVHYLLASASSIDQISLELDSMQNAAMRAIELEPNLGKAYIILGSANSIRGKFIEAELAYRKGIELTTESIDYYEYGLIWHYNVLGYLRKVNELIDEMLKKDPVHPFLRAAYMGVLGWFNDAERAEKEYGRYKVIFGDWIIGDLFINLLRLGSKDNLSTNDIPELKGYGRIFSIVRNHIEDPEEGLSELRRLYSNDDNLIIMDFFDISACAAYFGDPELAIKAMEKGSKNYSSGIAFFWLPVMKEVRQLPRFKEFVREIGLVDYWKEYGWPDLCRPVGDDDFECD